ncbi:MAG: CinA family protein [Anaerolineae bacterium]|nr:CinA family protein [Anaerolineae bacterium]
MAARLETRLLAGGWWLASAESCTGGMIAHTLTNIPGSSGCVLGGIVAYDNAVKIAELGVAESILQAHGAVSAECALAMAQGVRARFCAAAGLEQVIGISTTGIAGPGGGSMEKPIGLVYIGLSTPHGSRAYRQVWPYDRIGNKAASTRRALELVEQFLAQNPLPG